MAKIQINNPRQIINGGAKKYYFKVKGLGGPKGDKGDKGDTGSRGPQGEPGNAATVYVGSTTTLEVGQDATVENVGTQYNAVLNFGIPQGPRGPQGIQGERGEPGQIGQTGPRGPQGERGTNATVYVGTTTTTNPGTQARVYNSGTDSNAVLNFEIPRGDKGETGPMPTIAQTTGQSTTEVMSQKATTDALAAKQNTLTAGNNITISNDTISATDTTYTAGNGLNLNGTEFSADTTVLATKEDLDSYYTKPETDNLLAPKLEAEVVAELPTTGQEGKLYITPKAHTTQAATGNPITATVAEDAGKMESFQLDGDTFQQTYSGKNLFNPNETPLVARVGYNTYGEKQDWSNYVGFDQYMAVNPNTAYVFSCSFVSKTIRVVYYDNNKSVLSVTPAATSFTTPADCVYIRGCIYSQGEVMPEWAQIELGSEASSYEPYVGGTASPNPDYPQTIQTVTGEQTVELPGKNIFNPSAAHFITGQIESNKTLNTSSGSTVWILCAPNTTYTLSKSSTSRTRIGTSTELLDGTNTLTNVVLSGDVTPSGRNYGIITSGPNDKYMYITYDAVNNIDPSTMRIQIEVGSTVSDYEGYQATSYPLDLGAIELCKLGTYQDYIWKDGDDWKVHKATTTITLDGSSDENWSKSNNVFFEYSGYSYVGDVEAGSTAFSSSFIYWPNTGSISNNMPNLEFGLPATKVGIGIRNDSFADADALRTWLSTNVFKAYVSLATPTDTTITDTTLIAQLEAIRTASLENGTNTITNTATGSNLAGDMEIGYYGYNPTNRYDKWLWLDINNEYEQIGS